MLKVKYVLVVVLVVFVISMIPSVTSDIQVWLGIGKDNGRFETIKIIGICIGFLPLVWLAWSSDKRSKSMEDTVRNTEAGRTQERLRNAIEHLGHLKASVRMGGAYELFHLAEDNNDLRQTVMDILCSHIRQTTSEKDYQEKHKTEPSEEIKSILALLFMQEHGMFESCSINLRGSFLNGVWLYKAHLGGANLMQVQMQFASILKSELQRANLIDANLQCSTIHQSNLTGANLNMAKLLRCNLKQTKLLGALLDKADARKAYFDRVSLQGATLVYTRMHLTNGSSIDFQGADLAGVCFHGSTIKQMNMQGVDMRPYYHEDDFEFKIKDRVNKESNLAGVFFSGISDKAEVDAICQILTPEEEQVIREELNKQVGQPRSNTPPSGCNVETGSYTDEDAKCFIIIYNRHTQGVDKSWP